MSEHDTTTTNTAESGSTVGIQGGWVHNSTVYITAPDDPPERRYEVGLNYLNNGVPLRAREHIDDAIARGYQNPRVWFHWALAMLSKRSYRELSAEERAQLAMLPERFAQWPRDEWTRASEVLCELLAPSDDPGQDHPDWPRNPDSVLTKLRALPTREQGQIRHHCDLILTGGMRDSLWGENRREAHRGQHANDRADRVWAYFQPVPIAPRTCQPAPNSVTPDDQMRTAIATTLLVGALGCLGWALLVSPTPVAVIAYLALIAGGAVTATAGFEWQYRRRRLRAKDRENLGHDQEPPDSAFARRVDRSFEHYAEKYAPSGVDRAIWLSETRGARARLRADVVACYRDSRIPIRRVTWLIRFLVRDLRRRWRQHDLFAYREQHRLPMSTRLWCLSGIAVTVAGACVVADAALGNDPLLAAAGVLLAVTAGRPACLRWCHIVSERRRCADEDQQRAAEHAARDAEYQRWKDKLASICPDDDEMEAWLRCDRTILIDEALRHYRLCWRDITAYTIMQTPAKSGRRARVKGGPWRYSKYDLHLFLITAEGVREMATKLDVRTGTFHGHERGMFRFDAVSSLRVIESDTCDYTLELTLSNGPTRTIDFTEPERSLEVAHITPDEPGLAKTSLDATGFTHALHVLEGIAAEGKAWIHHATPPTHGSADPSSGVAA